MTAWNNIVMLVLVVPVILLIIGVVVMFFVRDPCRYAVFAGFQVVFALVPLLIVGKLESSPSTLKIRLPPVLDVEIKDFVIAVGPPQGVTVLIAVMALVIICATFFSRITISRT